MLNIAILGFGSRGQMFANLAKNDDRVKLIAVAEPIELSRAHASEFGVSKDMQFTSAEEFFKKGKICDAVFICTQDKQHYAQVIKAMELGYDVCLEKPAATSIEDSVSIRDTANRLGRKVMLTHVLRYAPFYRCIKDVILSGELGDVVHIDQTENIAYWHFGLSYVRGPWRSMADSTPTIMAKCCHDLDIINWLMNKKCESVSSFGALNYFKPDKAPVGSAEFCADCKEEIRENCVYNAYKVYNEYASRGVVGGLARVKGCSIDEIINKREDPISKCVFHSNNDAVDVQTVNMRYNGGATAHLTMVAFSSECHRRINVYGTQGEIFGDVEENTLTLNVFGKESKVIDVNEFSEGVDLDGGHGGGDTFLFRDFVEYLTTGKESVTRTTIDQSIESHVMGFLAEESRLNNGKSIDLPTK